MGPDRLEIEEINEIIRAVEERIESLELEREKLDAFKDVDAYRELEVQIRDLKDQQRMLNKRWSELTAGFSDNS
jgi:hypothetical protein